MEPNSLCEKHETLIWTLGNASEFEGWGMRRLQVAATSANILTSRQLGSPSLL